MALLGTERVLVVGVSPTGGLSSTQDTVPSQDIADLVGDLTVVRALQRLPDNGVDLESGDLFWNAGFLCKKA